MIEQIGPSAQQTASITESMKEQDLGRDAFLQLLVTQLQNQDPLDPVKNEDFVAQLSQFSSLEQLQQINEAVTDDSDDQALVGLQEAVESNTAVSPIGKKVEAPSETLTYTGEGSVQIGYNLTGSANKVTIRIFNNEGNLVRTLVENSPEAGNKSLVWDGENETGQSLSAGTYSVVPEAINGAGNSVTVTAGLSGTVTGIRYENGAPILMMDGGEAPLSAVAKISQTE